MVTPDRARSPVASGGVCCAGELVERADVHEAPRRIAAAHLIGSFFDADRCFRLAQTAVTKFLPLTEDDLEAWAADPEAFFLEQVPDVGPGRDGARLDLLVPTHPLSIARRVRTAGRRGTTHGSTHRTFSSARSTFIGPRWPRRCLPCYKGS